LSNLTCLCEKKIPNFFAIKNEEKLWMCMYNHLWCFKSNQIKKSVSESTQVKCLVWKLCTCLELLIYVTWVTQSGGHLIHVFHILGDQKWWPPLSCLYTNTHTHTHTHIYIKRERERERERDPSPYHFTLESVGSQVVGGPMKYRVKEHPSVVG
jgi:hypothetical protein